MRLRSGLAAIALALAGCGSSQASSQARTDATGSADCGPASAKTLVADPVARIYDTGAGVYGCSTKTRRRFRLGSSSRSLREGRVGPAALARSDAAYGLSTYGVDTGSAQVVVRRLTDGKILRTAPAISGATGPESYQSVAALVVKADGAAAWIGEGHSIIGHGRGIEVHRFDTRGQAELDHGIGISPASLRLHFSRLTWLHSGHKRSATLK
jgi:hypothetical protein